MMEELRSLGVRSSLGAGRHSSGVGIGAPGHVATRVIDIKNPATTG
jgi:hypothetical protein